MPDLWRFLARFLPSDNHDNNIEKLDFGDGLQGASQSLCKPPN